MNTKENQKPQICNRSSLLDDTPKITDEDVKEYGIAQADMTDGYCDDPEVMKKTMQCLSDKFLARHAILKANLQAKGEWKAEYDIDDERDAKSGDIDGMSIFEYEERYGENK